MTDPRSTARPSWSESPLPLPGLYPCLTWQLNVTVHKASGLGKLVSVVREPMDQVEVRRDYVGLTPWLDVRQALARLLIELPAMMGHLTLTEAPVND